MSTTWKRYAGIEMETLVKLCGKPQFATEAMEVLKAGTAGEEKAGLAKLASVLQAAAPYQLPARLTWGEIATLYRVLIEPAETP